MDYKKLLEQNLNLSLNEISKKFNIPYNRLYKTAKKYKKLNKKYSYKNNGKSIASKKDQKNRNILNEISIEYIFKLYEKGFSYKQIGEKLNRSSATICSIFKKHGLKARNKSEIMKKRMSLKENVDILREKSTNNYLKRKFKNTKPENDFELWLKKNNIDFEKQYRKVDYVHPYDFYLPKYNLLVEIDGYYWHNKEKQKKKDELQTKIAIDKGFNIVRICTKKLKDNDGDYAKWIILN